MSFLLSRFLSFPTVASNACLTVMPFCSVGIMLNIGILKSPNPHLRRQRKLASTCDVNTIRKFINRLFRFMSAYCKGLTGKAAEWAVRKHPSHQTVSETARINIESHLNPRTLGLASLPSFNATFLKFAIFLHLQYLIPYIFVLSNKTCSVQSRKN
jgi:hypothetical protein